MPYTKRYTLDYIEKVFGKVESKINLFTKLINSALAKTPNSNVLSNGIERISIYEVPIFKTDHDIIKDYAEHFDPEFWNDMLVYMNNYFDNRDTSNELPNCPCVELRFLRNSICHNQNVVNYTPQNPNNTKVVNDLKLTILKLPQGTNIVINREQFDLLKKAFKEDLMTKFTQ